MTIPHSKKLPLIALILSWFLFNSVFAQGTAEETAFNEAESYYAAGMRQSDRFQKGRYMTYVIGLYVQYLENYAGSRNESAARFHLGYARQTLGRIDEAKNTYRYLIERHRKGPFVGQGSRQMAYLAFVEEQWEEAAKYFDIAATNLPNQNLRHSALTKKVECLMKLNRPEDVTVALRQILDTKDHPHADWASFMLAYQYFERDDFKTTIRLLKPLMDAQKKGQYHSQAVFYTGLASAELGLENAQDSHLRTVLNMSINDPTLTPEQRRHLGTNKARAQTSLMGLYAKKQEWGTVISLFEKGDFGATGRTEARRCRRAGNAYMIKRDYLNARACFRRVDRALPDSPDAFDASFQCLKCDYYLKNPALAERVDIFFELYARKYPKHAFLHRARFFQGETLFGRKALEDAAIAFQKVDPNQLEPTLQAELLFKHGWCLSESGQFDGAARKFSRLLLSFPDDPRAAEIHNKRAEAHLALGDSTSALRDFEKVLTLETTGAQTAFALQGSARVLLEQKEYIGMIARYRRILSDYPSLPTDTIGNANYRIGWGYHKLGKYEESPPYLRKARNLVPEFYSKPVGDLLILGAFNLRDKKALHVALQEVYEQAPVKVIPQNMLSWLGVQMFHDGQIDEAVSYLEKATDPEVPKGTEVGVWRILAKAQNRAGKFTQAQQTSLLLLDQEENPRWKADAYLELAEARLGLKLYLQTIEAIEEGLALNAPGSHVAGLHIIRGEVSLHQKTWVEGLRSFQAAIAMIPDDPILQPRALYGAHLASLNAGNSSLAAEFKGKLTSRFPAWKSTLKLDQ